MSHLNYSEVIPDLLASFSLITKATGDKIFSQTFWMGFIFF